SLCLGAAAGKPDRFRVKKRDTQIRKTRRSVSGSVGPQIQRMALSLEGDGDLRQAGGYASGRALKRLSCALHHGFHPVVRSREAHRGNRDPLPVEDRHADAGHAVLVLATLDGETAFPGFLDMAPEGSQI